MDYRERVLNAIEFNEVYPVPVDVFENGMHPLIEKKLLEKFNIKNGVHEDVLKKLNAHLRWATPLYIGPPMEEGNFSILPSYPFKKIAKNIWGAWAGMESYTGIIERPLQNIESVLEVNNHTWPKTSWFDYNRLTNWTEEYWAEGDVSLRIEDWVKKNRDCAKIIGGWNPVFSRVLDLYGMDRGLLYMSSRPDLIHATVEKIGIFLEDFYSRMAKATFEHFDILCFGDDFAMQNSLLISPGKWKEYFLPLWKRLFAIGHKYNMKVMMHMCGAVYPVLADLIDAGLNIYEVVQVSAKGMEPEKLKKEFGKDLAFYGAIDVQQELFSGTPEEVRKKVRETIDILGKGGGYILSSSHLLTDDIPVENVIAMYDEAGNYLPF